MLFRRAKDLHDTGKLFLFVLARKDWIAGVELGQDTPQTPHINGHAIRHAEDDFGGTVESTLDICVHLLIFKAAGAKIDDFDFGGHRMHQKDILWLQVAVNNLLATQKDQTAEDLFRETTDEV